LKIVLNIHYPDLYEQGDRKANYQVQAIIRSREVFKKLDKNLLNGNLPNNKGINKEDSRHQDQENMKLLLKSQELKDHILEFVLNNTNKIQFPAQV
jgi:hypothetical protein